MCGEGLGIGLGEGKVSSEGKYAAVRSPGTSGAFKGVAGSSAIGWADGQLRPPPMPAVGCGRSLPYLIAARDFPIPSFAPTGGSLLVPWEVGANPFKSLLGRKNISPLSDSPFRRLPPAVSPGVHRRASCELSIHFPTVAICRGRTPYLPG